MRGVVATRSRLALPTTQTSQRPGMRRESARRAGAYADRRDQAEACGVALVLALAAPEPVLVLAAGEVSTCRAHGAAGAHLTCRRLSPLPRLGALGGGREEQVRQAFACRI